MKKNYLLLIIILCSTNLFGQIPTDSLVGFWKFNGNAIDGSTFNNDGTPVNGATYTFDRFNVSDRALKLIKNQQQYVSIPNNSSLKVDNELTISFWAKRTTFGGGVVDQVLNKGGDWITGNCNYGLVFSDNTLVFLHNNGYHGIAVPGIPHHLLLPYNGPYGSTLPGAPQDTLWHHYVVTTFHNSPIAYFYVDGVLVPTFYDGPGQNIVLNPNSNADLYIGGVHYYSNNILDDIRIYKKIVTQSEVTALFNETCNTANSFSVTACNSYTAPDNTTYYSSGTITSIIPNAEGCDSIITIALTINTVDTSVTQNGIQLMANATGATYQWLNCNNGYSVIVGETNPLFIANQNGNYAVEITQNGCRDTSACFLVNTVGIIENTLNEDLRIYPNPTEGMIKVDLGETMSEIVVNLNDLSGKLISQSTYKNIEILELYLTIPSGVYVLTINSKNKKASIKIIKN
ncbi:MAG: T9SS type A sorting domain-containing protein [Flavobacterium piscis]|nr:T9SS type A sorting domain-containing protein [Flavobacterium piscis]